MNVYRRQRRIYHFLLRFILKHLGFMIFLSVTIFPFIKHNSCSCLSLTVASSRFSPSNILLTHDCGTLSPVLPINPHHRHLGPPSRLSHSLSPSYNVHSKLSKSGPFQHRVPEHLSQVTRPAAFTVQTDRQRGRNCSDH